MGLCLKSTSTNRWPKGRVPYQIDASVFPAGSSDRQQLLLAINAWNSNSVIQFVAASGTDVDFVNFTASSDAKACSSPFGRQGGSQPVACLAGAAAGILMHEMGHALGLIHEHKRPDRNTYVTLNTGNIELELWKSASKKIGGAQRERETGSANRLRFRCWIA